jgi:DNA-binding XRE family transcriptional regulator
MPFTDYVAADRVVELREARGLSQEGLANAIAQVARERGWLKPGGIGRVDADTIRRIERDGHCPLERVRLVVALFFEVPIRDIWTPTNRRHVERQQTAVTA